MKTIRNAVQMLMMSVKEMFANKSGRLAANMIRDVIILVFTVVIALALYPVVQDLVNDINTTFDNSLTNALAGSSGLLALIYGFGLIALVFFEVYSFFFSGGRGYGK